MQNAVAVIGILVLFSPLFYGMFIGFHLLYFEYQKLTSWKMEAMAQNRFPPKLYYILRYGRWFPGRSVPVPESIHWHHAAVSAATEFGGLTFGMPWRNYPDLFFAENGYVSIHRSPACDEGMRGGGICEIGVFSTDAYDIELYMGLDGAVYINGEYRDDEYSLDPKARNLDTALKLLLLDVKPTIEDLIGTKGIWIKYGMATLAASSTPDSMNA